MSDQYRYTFKVSGAADSVDQFQRDLMDEEWFVSLDYKTSDEGKEYSLFLTATNDDLAETIDRATTNRDLVSIGKIEVSQVQPREASH